MVNCLDELCNRICFPANSLDLSLGNNHLRYYHLTLGKMLSQIRRIRILRLGNNHLRYCHLTLDKMLSQLKEIRINKWN